MNSRVPMAKSLNPLLGNGHKDHAISEQACPKSAFYVGELTSQTLQLVFVLILSYAG